MNTPLLSLGAILLVFSLCRASGKDSYATVDTLFGTVETQRAGSQKWKMVHRGDKVFNNDIVRAQAHSFVRLGWPDGSASFVHENTQILLAFYESDETNIISRHITVFYGAVYFVLKEILPKTFTKSYDVKIFTPTAVVSLRGTSLSVVVDNKSGNSTIEVINGSVMVRNIIKNASTYLSAGFKTTVSVASDPLVPQPLLDADISLLKSWVPLSVVEQEMSIQLARAEHDHDIIVGNLDRRIVVLPFVNSSKYHGPWKISSAIPRMLANRLTHTHCTVQMVDSTQVDPLVYGEKAKAKFVVTGEIQDFDITQNAEITVSADEYREYFLARVRLSVQLINVAQKKVVIDNLFSGDMRGPNVKDNSWQRIGRMTFSIADSSFSKSILGNALFQALDQSVDQLTRVVSPE